MRALKALCLFALAVGITMPAAASSTTGTLTATCAVATNCVIDSITTMDFSFYDPVDVNRTAPRDMTGSVTVRCVRGFLVWVTLGEGAHAATGSTCVTPQRRLAVTVNGTTDYLRYDFYRDAARTAVWGCDASNAQSYISAGVGAPTTLTVYGRIPGGQDPLVNWYVDNVEVTVWF